ncbi:MAG: hypothetical protein KDA86_22420 [Planctomycetaceae bacterium]|nr:hypothetical protein [Planctomycetaceae bacterium]
MTVSNETELDTELERLLTHLVERLYRADDDVLLRVAEIAADAIRDLLGCASDEMAADLFRPILRWSGLWTNDICHELIGEPDGIDYLNCEPSDWLAEIEDHHVMISGENTSVQHQQSYNQPPELPDAHDTTPGDQGMGKPKMEMIDGRFQQLQCKATCVGSGIVGVCSCLDRTFNHFLRYACSRR